MLGGRENQLQFGSLMSPQQFPAVTQMRPQFTEGSMLPQQFPALTQMGPQSTEGSMLPPLNNNGLLY